MTDTARVILWGRDIGAVTWLAERELGVFQYTPEFAESDSAGCMPSISDAITASVAGAGPWGAMLIIIRLQNN